MLYDKFLRVCNRWSWKEISTKMNKILRRSLQSFCSIVDSKMWSIIYSSTWLNFFTSTSSFGVRWTVRLKDSVEQNIKTPLFSSLSITHPLYTRSVGVFLIEDYFHTFRTHAHAQWRQRTNPAPRTPRTRSETSNSLCKWTGRRTFLTITQFSY